MATIIHSNGSRWLGQPDATVGELIDVLAQHRLDVDRFTIDGRLIFIEESVPHLPEHPNTRGTWFFGNFADVSHAFRIWSDDPAVVDPLRTAIRDNLSRQGISAGCASE